MNAAQEEVNQAAVEFETLRNGAKHDRIDRYRGVRILLPEIDEETDYVVTLTVKPRLKVSVTDK